MHPVCIAGATFTLAGSCKELCRTAPNAELSSNLRTLSEDLQRMQVIHRALFARYFIHVRFTEAPPDPGW